MEPNKAAGTADLWYVDNYILLKDYYDRTISRIAARCVRKGNIAIEDYPFFGYILDVLEEISETGEYILQHRELYPYVERKIAGGLNGLKKTLIEYQNELKSNSTPDMIKEDARKWKNEAGAGRRRQIGRPDRGRRHGNGTTDGKADAGKQHQAQLPGRRR